jgi:hypothetical protein
MSSLNKNNAHKMAGNRGGRGGRWGGGGGVNTGSVPDRRICKFLGHPDQLVRGSDPDPDSPLIKKNQ